MTKKEIVIPEFVDGCKIDGLGYERPKGGKFPLLGGMQAGNQTIYFDFENSIKKIYFESAYFLFGDETFKVINAENVEFMSWKHPFNIVDLSAGNFTWGYNVYDEYILNNNYPFTSNHKIANITYLYNYDNSPNKGYYWVDSYNNSLITFIPPIPKRDGYIFDGWYKEYECKNEWNFSIDKAKDEIRYIQGNKYNEYTGIYLYAK